jgi:hypothetical protein
VGLGHVLNCYSSRRNHVYPLYTLVTMFSVFHLHDRLMEEETSGSFSSVTGAESRDLNSGSGSRGDHGGEIQKTWSQMYIKYNHLHFHHCYLMLPSYLFCIYYMYLQVGLGHVVNFYSSCHHVYPLY